jgi:hypothetical protein
MQIVKRLMLAAGGIAAVGMGLLVNSAVGQAAVRQPVSNLPEVPPELKVPEGNKRVSVLAAKGVQVYTCTDGAWKILEPAATLSPIGTHKAVALHSRGPIWVSTVDGSAVGAEAVARVPRTNAVPELLLKANSTRGDGIFGKVSYIQRLRTTGGVAPTGACTGTEQIGIPYSAIYTFYVPGQ